MVNGADEFKKIGTEQSSGTKIFCVSGNVPKPGNYELPLGATFRDLLVDLAGCDPANIKGILPSGGSGPIVPGTDEVLDTKLTYEDMAGIGTILGSASVIVMDHSVDMTWVASKVTKFFAHESCGKCTPCREGTYWIDKVIDRILAGDGRPEDIKLIDNVAKNMAGTTLCALGDFAANPIIHTIKNFPADFEQHVAPKAVEEAGAKPARKGRAEARDRETASAGD
jgi:NADH-quinone oxidoreductase subunit F